MLPDDKELIRRLQASDEQAFRQLVGVMHRSMLRVSTGFVGDPDTAKEVVQETWLAVIAGIDTFEGRSSLRTWIYAVLSNIARKRAVREQRSVPWSSHSQQALGDAAADAASRYDGGMWATPPTPWGLDPESRAVQQQMLRWVDAAIDRLPASQQTVIVLRDVEGLSSGEVCEMLDITAANQRVLLHRARAKVRDLVDAMMRGGSK